MRFLKELIVVFMNDHFPSSAHQDEECPAYTMDDLEDGLEGEKTPEEPGQEEEAKNLSRISFAEPASTDTSRVEVDATPLMKRKKQKAAKSRKRKSTDLLEEDVSLLVQFTI